MTFPSIKGYTHTFVTQTGAHYRVVGGKTNERFLVCFQVAGLPTARMRIWATPSTKKTVRPLVAAMQKMGYPVDLVIQF